MGKWRAKVRSFARPTPPRSSARLIIGALVAAVRHRHRRATPSPPSVGREGEGREGANNTTPILVATSPPFSHSAGAAAGEAAKGEPATDGRGRVVSFSLPPSLPPSQDPYPATDLAVDLTVSYCSSRRAPPFLSPLLSSALLIQLLPLMEDRERRGKKGEREESPKTQTKLLPTD